MKKKVLTKALIVDHLNESIGLSKRECQNFFENFLELRSSTAKYSKSSNPSELLLKDRSPPAIIP